jgi:hypothetical protein
MFFATFVKRCGFGKFDQNRKVTPTDKQDLVRMNRDTLLFKPNCQENRPQTQKGSLWLFGK